MKYSLSRLMIGSLCLAFVAMQAMAQYSVTMPYKQVTVKNIGGKAVFDGAFASGPSGQPALPSYIISFLLLPGVDFSGVTASIDNPLSQDLADSFSIGVNPPIRHQDGTLEWPKGSNIVDGKDMNVFGQDAFFPSNFKGSVSCAHMRQYNVVNIRINPYLYNPVSKKLRMITGGTLTVSMASKAGATSSSTSGFQMRAKSSSAKAGTSFSGAAIIPRDVWVEKMLGKNLVNPAAFDGYGTAPVPKTMLKRTGNATPPTNRSPSKITIASATSAAAPAVAPAPGSFAGVGYLIISSNNTWIQSQGLTDYYNYLYNDLWADVSWVNEADVSWDVGTGSGYNPSGNLTAQQKAANIGDIVMNWYNWCYNYEGVTPKYVLLVGNPDPSTGDVPMYNYNGTPTDFYYADFSASWATDCSPWLSVGRIPVYNNEIGNLDNYLYKVMSYEAASGANVEWRRNFMAATVPLGWEIPAESHTMADLLISQLKPLGWGTYRLYDPYDLINNYFLVPEIVNMNPLPEHVYCHPDDVARTWNSETPGLVFLSGHGGGTGVGGVLSSNDVSQLNNSYPAIVWAQSCETLEPKDSLNLGSRTLFANAIAYIGATIGAGSKFMAHWFASDIANGFSTGDALGDVKYQAQDASASLFFNLYGCPEVALNLPLASATTVVQNFSAKAASKSQINLSWTAVANAGTYYIQRSQDHSVKRAGFSTIATVAGSATSYQNLNLSASTVYKYRINFDAQYGDPEPSGYSAIDSAGTYNASNVNLVAAVPTGVKVSAGSNSATVTWSTVSGATSYNVKRSIHSAGPFVTVANKTSATFLDSNLMNNTTYYFVVSSVNQYGQSATSGVVSIVPTSALVVPQLSPMSLYNDGIPRPYVALCRFTVPAGDNDLGFRFESALKFPDGTYGQFDDIGSTQRQSDYGWTWNQSTNSSFAFRMYAVNEANKSGYSNIVEYATPIDTGARPPAAPTGLTATANSPTQFTVNWTNGTTSPLPDSTQVFYKPVNGTWQKLNVAYPGKSAVIAAAPHTKYQIYARAIKNSVHTDVTQAISCSNYAGITVTTPTALSTPSGLLAMPGFKGQINLTWNDANSGASGFLIEKATSASGPFSQIAVSTIKSYLNSGLGDGMTSWYRVRTYKTTDTSSYSNTSSAVTLANIAISKTSTASGYQTANPVRYGNDNSVTSRWCALNSNASQWWTVDLGSARIVATGEVMWEQSGSGKVYKYKIETSIDNNTWTMAADKTANTSTAQTQTCNFTTSTMLGRYVRITTTALPSGAYASFYEFRVFGR